MQKFHDYLNRPGVFGAFFGGLWLGMAQGSVFDAIADAKPVSLAAAVFFGSVAAWYLRRGIRQVSG